MIIDATFWVAVSFFIFFGGLVYLKVPQKVNKSLTDQINLDSFSESTQNTINLIINLLDALEIATNGIDINLAIPLTDLGLPNFDGSKYVDGRVFKILPGILNITNIQKLEAFNVLKPVDVDSEYTLSHVLDWVDGAAGAIDISVSVEIQAEDSFINVNGVDAVIIS